MGKEELDRFDQVEKEAYELTDSQLLSWFETQEGAALISDDQGHWVVSYDGCQSVSPNPPADCETLFFIEQHRWCPSVRDALRCAWMEDQDGVTPDQVAAHRDWVEKAVEAAQKEVQQVLDERKQDEDHQG